MADKWTAVNTLWNGFGITAYDENTVPNGAAMPYITYSVSVAGLDEPVYLSASLWYRSMSWEDISKKAEQISEAIGGGAGVAYDGGRLWVTRGDPFAQRMSEPEDGTVRRILLQVKGEFQ